MNLVAGADPRLAAFAIAWSLRAGMSNRAHQHCAFTKRLQHLSDGIPQSAGVGLFFQTYQCCMRLVSVPAMWLQKFSTLRLRPSLSPPGTAMRAAQFAFTDKEIVMP